MKEVCRLAVERASSGTAAPREEAAGRAQRQRGQVCEVRSSKAGSPRASFLARRIGGLGDGSVRQGRRGHRRRHHEAAALGRRGRASLRRESLRERLALSRDKRNEGRVRALKALREESRARRSQQGKVQLSLQEAQRSGRLVFDVEHLHLQYGERVLVADFSTVVMRGDRIALIGDNGVGKTTLIRALLGESSPEIQQSGQVHTGTQLTVAYFDQLRDQLDLDATVLDNLCQGSDFLEINGQKKHALSYLQDFLFSPQRARTPVRALSGGERNRLLLARLLLKPSNLLVLDEPTNDLDMVTLELLEETLSDYPGTLLLISHDRAFVDAMATSTWVFDGRGGISEYVGGYQDYLQQVQRQTPAPTPAKAAPAASPASVQPVSDTSAAVSKKAKLSYKEQRELDQLPGHIAALEEEQAALSAQLADGQWFLQDAAAATQASVRLTAIEEELMEKLERWTALEAASQGA